MKSGKLGLVLAGGGGKGAYHIGVWRALREYGVEQNIQAISGTSVGALNGALFALGDYELAESIWRGLTYDKVLSLSKNRILALLLGAGLGSWMVPEFISLMAGSGVFTRQGLQEIIERKLDLGGITHSTRSVIAGVYNLSKMRMEYKDMAGGDAAYITKVLLASSALPVIYPQEIIDGDRYIDGGVADNVPILPLYQRGCRVILAVHLSRDSLLKQKQKYKDARILEIVPSEDQGNFAQGTLDFSAEGIDRRIQQGYHDTCRVLKPVYEMGMTQKQIGAVLQGIKQDNHHNRYRQREIMEERNKFQQQRNLLWEELQEELDHE